MPLRVGQSSVIMKRVKFNLNPLFQNMHNKRTDLLFGCRLHRDDSLINVVVEKCAHELTYRTSYCCSPIILRQ